MSVLKKQPVLMCEEDEESTDRLRCTILIDEYANLQRIKFAPDRDKEIDYQIAVMKAKLKVFGVNAEILDIHQS